MSGQVFGMIQVVVVAGCFHVHTSEVGAAANVSSMEMIAGSVHRDDLEDARLKTTNGLQPGVSGQTMKLVTASCER